MADFAVSDGPYVSQRWRIGGGPAERLDDFRWLAEQLVGSTDSCLDLLLKESATSDGWRITALVESADAELLRRRNEATKLNDAEALEFLDNIRTEFNRRVPAAQRDETLTDELTERRKRTHDPQL